MEPTPIKAFPTRYQVWFLAGGYKTFDTFEEASTAGKLGRGPIYRIDKLTRAILWVTDDPTHAEDI